MHPNIQDAIKYYENDERIIAVVADGLGSKRHSAYGARLICRLISEEMKSVVLPIESFKIKSVDFWYSCLKNKGANIDEYCTTCSFAVIEKNRRMIGVGQIGDSPIYARIDTQDVITLRQEKVFSNITACLGENEKQMFAVRNYSFSSNFNLLVSSDGLGDELNTQNMDSMFSYLSDKYENYKPKSRSRKFTKEIKSTIGKVNNDDKSAIYIWSK